MHKGRRVVTDGGPMTIVKSVFYKHPSFINNLIRTWIKCVTWL